MSTQLLETCRGFK